MIPRSTTQIWTPNFNTTGLASSDTEEEDEYEIEAGLLPLDTPLPLSGSVPTFPPLSVPRNRNPLEYGEEEDELETPYATPAGTPVPHRAVVIPGRLAGGGSDLAGSSVLTPTSTPTRRRRQAGKKNSEGEASPSPSLALGSSPGTVSAGGSERGEETVRRSTRAAGILGLGLGRRGDVGDRV